MPSPATQDFTRDELRQFLPTDQAIKKFERILRDLRINVPADMADATRAVEQALNVAETAIAVATSNASELESLRAQIEAQDTSGAPAVELNIESLRSAIEMLLAVPREEPQPFPSGQSLRDYSFTYLHMGA